MKSWGNYLDFCQGIDSILKGPLYPRTAKDICLRLLLETAPDIINVHFFYYLNILSTCIGKNIICGIPSHMLLSSLDYISIIPMSPASNSRIFLPFSLDSTFSVISSSLVRSISSSFHLPFPLSRLLQLHFWSFTYLTLNQSPGILHLYSTN